MGRAFVLDQKNEKCPRRITGCGSLNEAGALAGALDAVLEEADRYGLTSVRRDVEAGTLIPAVQYLRAQKVRTLIRRVLQSRGMDYWESGMDMKLGDDIYESFRAYQRSLLKEYASMADEFGFRVLDARRKISVIQDELRRQIGAFLAESDTTSAARIDGQP